MGTRAAQAPILAADTSHVRPHERFDYFCDALCDVYLGIRPQRTTPAAFEADVLAFGWDDLVLSRIRAPGHDARRAQRMIAAKPDDALFLNFCDNARSRVAVDGGVRELATGAPILLDNSRPFHLRFDSARRFHLYSLRLPRQVDGRTLEARDVATVNQRLRASRTGRQLTLQTRLMSAEFDAGRTAVAGMMAQAVAGLLAVLTGTPDAEATPGRFAAFTTTARSRLSSRSLGVHEIAAVHAVSVRTVQAAFAAEGTTLTAWLLRERLELARDRLGDPAWRTRSVEQVARSCGIADPSSFHRAFRSHFGDTPGAFRP